jgi:hypothetical protein
MKLRRKTIAYLEGDAIRPSNLTKGRVEEYAQRVAELAGFEIGEHPGELVKQFGGDISFQELGEWLKEDGSIFVHGEADFDILLPSYTSPLRDRFTIAHELGHYFLHSRQGERPIVAYREGSSSRIEWEANWFAAALLMPRDAFIDECGTNPDIAAVALRFGVSQDAARVRKVALGV